MMQLGNSAICGHDRQRKFLARFAERGISGQAFLFAGPAMVGKRTIALHFAARLFCENLSAADNVFSCGRCLSCRRIFDFVHPDFSVLSAFGGETIGIRDIHELIRKLGLSSYAGGWRGALIDGAEKLSPDAQSALLKFLEELPGRTLLFLVTDRRDALLLTVRSRLFPVLFSAVAEGNMRAWAEKEFGKARINDRLIAAADGRPGLLKVMMQQPKVEQEEVRQVAAFLGISKKNMAEQFAFAESIAAKDHDTAKHFLLFLVCGARDAMRRDPSNILLLREKLPRLLELLSWFERTAVSRRTLIDLAILHAYHSSAFI